MENIKSVTRIIEMENLKVFWKKITKLDARFTWIQKFFRLSLIQAILYFLRTIDWSSLKQEEFYQFNLYEKLKESVLSLLYMVAQPVVLENSES